MSQHLYKLGGNYLCYIATAITTGTAIFHLWAIGDMGILEENKCKKQEDVTEEVGLQSQSLNFNSICNEFFLRETMWYKSMSGFHSKSPCKP